MTVQSDFTIEQSRESGKVLIRANNEAAWEWLLDHERGGNYNCHGQPMAATATSESAADWMDRAEARGLHAVWVL